MLKRNFKKKSAYQEDKATVARLGDSFRAETGTVQSSSCTFQVARFGQMI